MIFHHLPPQVITILVNTNGMNYFYVELRILKVMTELMNEYVVNLIFEDLFGSYYTNIRFFIFIFIHLLFIYYLEICHILLDIFIIEANMNIDNDNNNNNNNRTAIVEFNQLKTSLYEQAVNKENKIE